MGTLRASTTPRPGTLRSLRVRNYRLYFLGQLSSLCGTWMQSVALAWLVLDLTDSGAQVGLVTSLQFFPLLVLGGAAGLLIDRLDRRRSLLGAEVLLAVQAALLAGLVVGDVVELWMLYVLSAVQGVGNALEQPGRQALLSELVGDADLPNAVSLNAALFTMSRVVGPALAGVVISTAGVGLCFTINAVSFVGIILALVAMRPAEMHHRARVARAKGQLREGVRYVVRSQAVLPLFLSTAFLALFTQNLSVVLPIMARDVFGGGAGTYGLMAAVASAGSVVAAFGLAASGAPSDRRIMLTATALGLSLIGSALAPTLALELVVLPAMGAAQLAALVSSNAAMQLRTPVAVRGRVIALYFSVNAGAQALGSLVMGSVIDGFGTRWALAVSGVVTTLVGMAWISRVRRSTGVAVGVG